MSEACALELVEGKHGHTELLFIHSLVHLQVSWNTSLSNFCQHISLWLCMFLELNKVVHSASVLRRALQLLFVHLKNTHSN